MGAGVVVCLERGADLHMAQLMPLPLTVSCFSEIQIGFTFLVPAHLGSPGKGPLNVLLTYLLYLLTCVCVCFDTVSWTSASEVMTLWRYTHTLINNNNNNDRLTAFDPGQPG